MGVESPAPGAAGADLFNARVELDPLQARATEQARSDGLEVGEQGHDASNPWLVDLPASTFIAGVLRIARNSTEDA
eukprot:6478892-Alexandrium_andersonii.AAC.1